jgi:large subunit ribosomal protein L25
MADVVIEVEERNKSGKNESRRLRHAGRIPAILYGAGKPVLSVTVDPRDLEQVLHSESGENTLLDLRLKGKGSQRKAMIKDYQADPLTGRVMHADFIRIEMDTKLEISVPVRAVGIPPGVKEQGGLLEILQRELKIECLPGDIPEQIEVDVSELNVHDHIWVENLRPSGNFRFLDPMETLVINVVPPRLVEEEAAPVEAEEEAEPEVIAKGKKEEAEAAEGESRAEGKE